MSNRTEALARLTIGILWFFVASLFLVIVWLPIAALVMLADIVIQLISNRGGIPGTNSLTQFWGWYSKNLEWLITGRERFDPVPYA